MFIFQGCCLIHYLSWPFSADYCLNCPCSSCILRPRHHLTKKTILLGLLLAPDCGGRVLFLCWQNKICVVVVITVNSVNLMWTTADTNKTTNGDGILSSSTPTHFLIVVVDTWVRTSYYPSDCTKTQIIVLVPSRGKEGILASLCMFLTLLCSL